ncbi:MAG TPA: cytochrome C oxidase subunit IV family protein [Ferruginibacter sp.]|nr:cytochrome C oxidase subunit IV family protein [Ferruginibacter sp.]
MSSNVSSPEITHAPEHASGTGRIWKTFWVLSALTVVELALGYLLYYKHGEWSYVPVISTKLAIAALTLLKAYYIVSIFMHLGDEIRNMIMTIIVPLMLFIWFIAAFLWDGNAWKNLRNTNGHSRPADTQQQHQPAVDKDAKK